MTNQRPPSYDYKKQLHEYAKKRLIALKEEWGSLSWLQKIRRRHEFRVRLDFVKWQLRWSDPKDRVGSS